MPKETVQNWSVQGINKKIKNKFCARAKEKDVNIPVLLESVLEDWLERDAKRSEQK